MAASANRTSAQKRPRDPKEDPTSGLPPSRSRGGRWYCVLEGRGVGVFDSWPACKAVVEGVKGARYKSYDTYEAATTAFVADYVARFHKRPPSSAPSAAAATAGPVERWRTCVGGPEVPFYCTDAACNNPAGGRVEFRCVYAKDKSSGLRQVFSYGPFEVGSNNIGEYLGLVRALMWIKEQAVTEAVPVYTDSKVAIGWVTRNRRSNSHLRRIDPELTRQLAVCDAWMSDFRVWPLATRHVRHWNTEKWGEIPADYDRK